MPFKFSMLAHRFSLTIRLAVRFHCRRICYSILLCAFSSNAAEPSIRMTTKISSAQLSAFEITPQVCIVKTIGDICQLTTQFNWQAVQALEACLVLADNTQACWQQTQAVSETVLLQLVESSEIILQYSAQNTLASSYLKVYAVNPKGKRRRLRSAWGIF